MILQLYQRFWILSSLQSVNGGVLFLVFSMANYSIWFQGQIFTTVALPLISRIRSLDVVSLRGDFARLYQWRRIVPSGSSGNPLEFDQGWILTTLLFETFCLLVPFQKWSCSNDTRCPTMIVRATLNGDVLVPISPTRLFFAQERILISFAHIRWSSSIHRHTGTVLFQMLGYLCFKFRSDSTHYHYFGCGLSWRRIFLSETAPSLLSKAVLLQSATPFRDHSHQHFSTSYSEFLYLPAPHQSAFRVRPWLTMSADSFELRGDR